MGTKRISGNLIVNDRNITQELSNLTIPERFSIAYNLVVNMNQQQFDMIGVQAGGPIPGGMYPLTKWSDPQTNIEGYTYRTLQHREYDETNQQFTAYTTANEAKAKELVEFLTGLNVLDSYNATKPTPCFVFCTESNTCWKLQYDGSANGLRAYKVNNFPLALKPKNITATVASSAWTSDANIAPFDYKATITLAVNINTNTIVELVNNNAVAFATYGFSIGDVTGQVVTIYSIGQPSANIDFLIKVGE